MTTTVELVKNWLAEEGYKGIVDEDGNLQFKYQGLNMWVNYDKNDPLFLSILMPRIYDMEEESIKEYKAVNEVNSGIKAVKGYAVDNSVWLGIEMYIDSSPEIADYFERWLDILVASAHKFYDYMNQ